MTFSGHGGRVQEFRSLNALLIGELETLLQAALTNGWLGNTNVTQPSSPSQPESDRLTVIAT